MGDALGVSKPKASGASGCKDGVGSQAGFSSPSGVLENICFEVHRSLKLDWMGRVSPGFMDGARTRSALSFPSHHLIHQKRQESR